MTIVDPVSENWLKIAGEMIKEGRAQAVRSELEALRLKQIRLPRKLWLPLAQLARRTALPQLTLWLFHKHIKSAKRGSEKNVSPLELAEYAAALNQIGATQESLRVYSSFDVSKHSPSALLNAFSYFSDWNYSAALPLLRQHVSQNFSNEYDRWIAELNLAACLGVLEQNQESFEILQNLLTATEGNQSLTLLRGNILMLIAQSMIQSHHFKEAQRFLLRGKELNLSVTSLDAILLEKWDAFAEWKSGNASNAYQRLKLLSVRARELKYWEAFREIQFFTALVSGDHEGIAHVYFGTPFSGYRRRIESFARDTWQVPNRCILPMKGGKRAPLFDPLLGDSRLKPGQISQRLLLALVSDIYRPLRIATLHERVFPGRYFDPFSSPIQMSQALARLRRKLKSIRSPFKILESRSTYRLVGVKPCRLLLSGVAPGSDELQVHRYLRSLHESKYSEQGITRPQAAKLWNCSSRKAFTVLSLLVKNQQIKAVGTTRDRKYILAD